ncbi:hypothetical protein POTOM_021313 [Populus tomentosa]|uniref:LysM domain-containing protein n=1 Tax=Populus tomentosa TaxID=118781 RepID=A0A8X7ZTN5_POPTO|nr:hypothetical protein POTOM_021313 [Populus tomentosa]
MFMAISLLPFFSTQALLLLILLFSSTHVSSQAPPASNFSCPVDSPTTCSTYFTYLAQPPNFLDIGNISDLFGVTSKEIAAASNLESEDTPLFPNQLLLVPKPCGCTASDDLTKVAAILNASERSIVIENNCVNFTAAVYLPVLIPVSQLPVLSQQYPSPERIESRNRWIIIVAASIASALLIFLLIAFLAYKRCSYKRTKALDRTGSCLETSDLNQTKELTKLESFEAKVTPDKLLPGVSGYLGKPIIYEVKEIMEGTMDLNEHYKIGGSVYRATINGRVLAVKKTKDDVTEELKILQKVSHAISHLHFRQTQTRPHLASTTPARQDQGSISFPPQITTKIAPLLFPLLSQLTTQALPPPATRTSRPRRRPSSHPIPVIFPSQLPPQLVLPLSRSPPLSLSNRPLPHLTGPVASPPRPDQNCQ